MSLFESLCGEAESFCQASGLLPLFEKGVAVALSGGADSVFLLHLIARLSKKKDFPFCAFHVNHGLRCEESDRDENFCRSLCKEMKIDFFSVRVSVSSRKEEYGETLEEAARHARYGAFADFLDTHTQYAYLLTAHTASDNLETVLFRLARGTGLRGLCGIPAKRERFLRPLLSLNGEDIRASLNEMGYSYVFDSSNRDPHYKRNYIRSEVVPSFLRIHEDVEKNVTRVCRNLSLDEEYLEKEAHAFLEKHEKDGRVLRSALAGLHEAIFIRVTNELYRRKGGMRGCEGVHLQNAYALLCSKSVNGRVDFPDDLAFCVTRETVFFEEKNSLKQKKETHFEKESLVFGENVFESFGLGITFKTQKDDAYLKKLKDTYRQVFFADLSKSYGGGTLYLREREEGDAYRYGGMTHKVKKMFSDRKIPIEERKKRLLLCDDLGILWIPGFSPREPREKKTNTIYAYFFMNGGKDE